MKVNGELITEPGLIGDVIHETKAIVTMRITDLYFPMHRKPWRDYQVCKERQEYFREILIGQTRRFWKTGSRAGYEVGGNRFVSEW